MRLRWEDQGRALWSLLPVGLSACSIFATRPTQELSDTLAAFRAAREVQADTLAPDTFRHAGEWLLLAKRQYKIKNFQAAQEYLTHARRLAEIAEFKALKRGAARTDVGIIDPITLDGGDPVPKVTPTTRPTPYDYPTPTGTPADEYEARKSADDAAKASAPPPKVNK